MRFFFPDFLINSTENFRFAFSLSIILLLFYVHTYMYAVRIFFLRLGASIVTVGNHTQIRLKTMKNLLCHWNANTKLAISFMRFSQQVPLKLFKCLFVEEKHGSFQSYLDLESNLGQLHLTILRLCHCHSRSHFISNA